MPVGSVRIFVGALTLSSAIAACGDERPSGATYCARVSANITALASPMILTEADVDAQISLYRDLAAVAPLAVSPEWDTMVTTLVTANTVDSTDPESLQRAADAARLANPAAQRIVDYTLDLCDINIPAGVVPSTVPTATTTTVV